MRTSPAPAAPPAERLTGLTQYGGCCRGCGAAIVAFTAEGDDREKRAERRAALRRQGWDLARGLCPECAGKNNHQGTRATT